MTIIPAYGRDYTSAKKAKDDFNSDKDFIICDFFHPADGKYCNKAQLKKEGVIMVNIRYNRLTKVTIVRV